MRDWVTNVRTTHYILGTAYGAHPYPLMVRNFQRVIGDEARRQILEKEKRLPDLLIACVGGGSNAMGLFYPFLNDESVKMVGVEAGGEGIATGKHAARFQGGSLGVLQGHALLPVAGRVRPDPAHPQRLGRAGLRRRRPRARLAAGPAPRRIHLRHRRPGARSFQKLARLEGIIPALESAHAIAEVIAPRPGWTSRSLSSSTSPAGATKTSRKSRPRWGCRWRGEQKAEIQSPKSEIRRRKNVWQERGDSGREEVHGKNALLFE